MKKILILMMVALFSLPALVFAQDSDMAEIKSNCETEATEEGYQGTEKQDYIADCIRYNSGGEQESEQEEGEQEETEPKE